MRNIFKQILTAVLCIVLCAGILPAQAFAADAVSLSDKITAQGISIPKNVKVSESGAEWAYIAERAANGKTGTADKRSAPDKNSKYVIGTITFDRDRAVLLLANSNGYSLVEYGIEFFWIKEGYVEKSSSSVSGTDCNEKFTASDASDKIAKFKAGGVSVPKGWIPTSVSGVFAVLEARSSNNKAVTIDIRSMPDSAKRYDVGNLKLNTDRKTTVYGYYNGYALIKLDDAFYWIKAAYVEPSAWTNTGDIEVGDYIFFGSYPQGADGETEPIEWKVLAKEGNKVMVISRYALDVKAYDDTYTSLEEMRNAGKRGVTWDECTLRTWLNNDFLNKAFSSTEKKAIQKRTVTADYDPDWFFTDSDQGKDTKDKIFLLSVLEVRDLDPGPCAPTAYVKTKWKYDWTTWYLRSSDAGSGYGYIMDSYEDQNNEWCCDINPICETACIRPAMWIDLES